MLTDVELTEPPAEWEVEEAEDSPVEDTRGGPEVFSFSRFWESQLRVRYHRADLYLVLAIIVAIFTMAWVLWATPAAGAHGKPRLSPWERTLVGLGLAEESAPVKPTYRGNPNVRVWVDPHTALYYCPGEEQYGKTPDGRYSSQREAQMDRFEPSARAACE